MSVDEQVFLYLRTKGEKKFNAGPPVRLAEYCKLTWFWKNLGLNKFDLDKLNPEYLAEMHLTGIGVERYQQSKASEKPPQGTVTQSGKFQRKTLV